MKNKLPDGYYSGISGLQLPVPKYQFPEEHQSSSRLTYYSTLFNSIEINSSFYKVPLGRTVLKWSNEVVTDFKFTFKLWQEITHIKNLLFKEADVLKFIEIISKVGDKKGTLLIQFPPSLRIDSRKQLIRLLNSIKEVDPLTSWPVALEFRNKTWYNETIYELVESYGASIVVHDKTRLVTPSIHSSVNFVYLRFHGPTGDYRGSYSDDFLSEYAGYISGWLEEGKAVYVYFNNTMGEAIANLTTLNKYVIERNSDRPK